VGVCFGRRSGRQAASPEGGPADACQQPPGGIRQEHCQHDCGNHVESEQLNSL
jgi:hypothetical protein